MMKTLLSSFSLLLILVLAGCAEKPKTLGGDMLDPNAIFTTTEFSTTSQSDTTYKTNVVNGYGPSNLAGRLNANQELISLLNFIPAVALDSLKGAVIDTAEIRLSVNYQMTPASYPIGFELHEVKQSWAQASFSADSLRSATIDPIVLSTVSDSMNYLQQITVRLDSSIVRRWSASYYDTSQPKFYGFALQAKPNTTTGVIGFSTFSAASGYIPTLVIKYSTKYTHDSLVISSGEDTYVGRFSTPPVLSKFQVQGGFGIRSKVKFDLSQLTNMPNSKRPTINKVVLTLTMDTTASVRSPFSADSLLAFLSLSSSVIDSISPNSFVFGVKQINQNGDQVYQFSSSSLSITNIVQRWVNNINSNYGFTLRWGSETGTSDRIVFYNSAEPDSTKRPKLYIMYSTK